jgi:hypothetical protein
MTRKLDDLQLERARAESAGATAAELAQVLRVHAPEAMVHLSASAFRWLDRHAALLIEKARAHKAEITDEVLRMRALAKLTDEDKRVLGILR